MSPKRNPRLPTRRTVNRRTDCHAFTLVELLVSIGIVILLITLLLPMGKSAIKKAQSAKCQSNLRQLGVAMLSYTSENQIFPSESWGINKLYANPQTLSDFLDPNSAVWFCPTIQKTRPLVNGGGRYCYNWRLTNLPSWKPALTAMNPLTIVSPTKAMIFADLDTAARGGYHNGFSNVLFADGHVESHVDVGLKDYSKVTVAADPALTVNAEYIAMQPGWKLKGYDY